MNARRVRLIRALLILALASGCKPKTATPIEEAYTPMEGAVSFDAKLESGSANLEQATTWLGSSQSEGHSATFRFELGPSDAGNGAVPIRFGKGKFLSVTGSDATMLLSQLKTALQAKVAPQRVKRASSLPFEYIVLARGTRHNRDGSLGDQKTGDWIALKLFFGDDESEVFMNLNPVINKGEFTIKDPDYGDGVLSELAKVL